MGHVLTAGTRCPSCTRAHRGTTTERGYGHDYQVALAQLHDDPKRPTHCPTCEQPFTADNPATGGHTVKPRDGGTPAELELECRRCNYGRRRDRT